MARKPFAPKPFAPGADVDFPELGISGVVWSAGPVASSLWVAVDGDTTRLVLVKRATKTRPASVLSTDDGRSRVRLAEAVREGLAYVSRRRTTSRYSGATITYTDLHADLACPKATGAEIEVVPAEVRPAAARAIVRDDEHAVRGLGLGRLGCACLRAVEAASAA